MSVLLLVRNEQAVNSAVNEASDFLMQQRKRAASPDPADEVVGIWLLEDLDAGLPSWPGFDEAAIGIRESFALSGTWALCWVDGAALHLSQTAAERRRKILEAFASKVTARPRSFLPVFQATDRRDARDAAMQELRESYPRLISGGRYVDDQGYLKFEEIE
jgi:hypothetical protein